MTKADIRTTINDFATAAANAFAPDSTGCNFRRDSTI